MIVCTGIENPVYVGIVRLFEIFAHFGVFDAIGDIDILSYPYLFEVQDACHGTNGLSV